MNKYRKKDDLNKYSEKLISELCNGNVSVDEYFEFSSEASGIAYLSRKEPWAQSGHGGDAYSYRYKKMMILEAIYYPGSFLDIGSANGYLIECLSNWTKYFFPSMEFYGLEINEELTNLSKKLWPHFKDNFYNGNVFHWKPIKKFDYVYSMIFPDLPNNLHEIFLKIIMSDYLKKDGRLILGEYNTYDYEDDVVKYGYKINGFCEKRAGENKIKKIIWVDNT